jgi:hypothetical protein
MYRVKFRMLALTRCNVEKIHFYKEFASMLEYEASTRERRTFSQIQSKCIKYSVISNLKNVMICSILTEGTGRGILTLDGRHIISQRL